MGLSVRLSCVGGDKLRARKHRVHSTRFLGILWSCGLTRRWLRERPMIKSQLGLARTDAVARAKGNPVTVQAGESFPTDTVVCEPLPPTMIGSIGCAPILTLSAVCRLLSSRQASDTGAGVIRSHPNHFLDSHHFQSVRRLEPSHPRCAHHYSARLDPSNPKAEAPKRIDEKWCRLWPREINGTDLK